MLETMKPRRRGAARAGIEFMLGGGIAVWARGGPTTDHDVDPDAARGRRAPRRTRWPRPVSGPSRAGGVAAEGVGRRHPGRPDLPPGGRPIGDEHFARAEDLEVMAVRMPVAVGSGTC